MTEKTPKRRSKNGRADIPGFSPVIFRESPGASPQNLTGSHRVIRDLVADLFNTIQHWNDDHIRGAGLVKQIAAERPRCYTDHVEKLTKELYDIVQEMGKKRDFIVSLVLKAAALQKLLKEADILFISLTPQRRVELVKAIADAYEEEFKIKEYVLEHIAHGKDKPEQMFHACMWIYQTKADDSIRFKLEILLVETGLHKFS